VLSSSVSRDTARLPVAFVDEAGNEAAARLKQELAASTSLSSESMSSARDAVQRGDRLAYVRVRPGFPGASEVELGTDPSRVNEGAMVKAVLGAAVMKLSAHLATDPIKQVPVLRSGTPPNAFALVFPAAIVWGLMGCAATFAVSMVAERTGGTLIRLRAAPVASASIVLGKALACAVACLVDAALLLVIARLGFGVRIDSPLGLVVALAALTACFVGLTMFLSALGNTEQAVSGAGWATLLFLAMLGGAMVPVSLMPGWMQRLSDLSPIRWGISALEGALWRGLGPEQLLVPCLVLTVIGALGFVLGQRLGARREA
jgi:ABC-2 type transport system permease protein